MSATCLHAQSGAFVVACGAFASLLAACGRPTHALTMTVDTSQVQDGSCAGVAGFVVTVQPQGKQSDVLRIPNRSPTHPNEGCHLSSPVTADDIDVDVQIIVSVEGFDSLKTRRISGTLAVPSLESPGSQTLALKPDAAGGALPILEIDRSTALSAGTSVGEVTAFHVALKGNGGDVIPLVPVEADTTPFFAAGEPGAFAFPSTVTLSDGDTVDIELFFGAQSNSARYTVSQLSSSPPYWQASAR